MGNPEPEAKVRGDAKSSSINQRRWPDYVVNYLNFVMKTFEHQPETYREFFQLMADYRNYRTSADCLIVKVNFLFKEHKELLKGFNQFVPRQYKGYTDFKFDDAIAFARKIKDTNMSDSFLQVLYNYSTGTYDLEDTFVKVCKLFKGHPDLLIGYQKHLTTFISEQSKPTAIPASSARSAAIVYIIKVKARFEDQQEKYRGFITILEDFTNYRITLSMAVAKVLHLFKGDHELIMGFNSFLPEHCKIDKKILVEYDRVTDIINTIKSKLQYDSSMIGPFIKILDKYNSDTITSHELYTEVMEILKNYPDLLDELRIPILMAYLSVAPARRHLFRQDLIE